MNSQRSLRRIIAIEMYLTRLRPGIVGRETHFAYAIVDQLTGAGKSVVFITGGELL